MITNLNNSKLGEIIKLELHDVISYLPGYNCKDCGFSDCSGFAKALIEKKAEPESCRYLQRQQNGNLDNLRDLLGHEIALADTEKPVGVLDGYVADFVLKPLKDECSCREVLYPFYQQKYEPGALIRYRPIGCPIPHFAEIIEENKGLITVHMIGPCHRIGSMEKEAFEDIGVCMIGGFIGLVEGSKPKVGHTVRFIPKGCMMQKVHSGIVVQIEGDRAIIEGIDLKVWSLPEAAN
jgi:Predicted Fe-S protein